MTALPPISEMTGSTVTEGQFKAALTDLRSYLAGLLGDTGMATDATAILGTLLSRTLGKTAAYTASTSDRGALILASGSWTLGLPAAATAGAGFCLGLANTGSGTVTVDPAGSELIDGAATSAVPAGQAGLLVSTGAAWISLGFAGPVSGRVLAANGSDEVPAISFAADPDSGFYRAGPNDIRMALGGADAGLYRRGTVLGAVGQSGGIPTGALIEQGSNGNGRYTRYADGTQICYARVTSSTTDEVTWTYPAAFVAPAAEIMVLASPFGSGLITYSSRFATKGITAASFSNLDSAGARRAAGTDLAAIGRWF